MPLTLVLAGTLVAFVTAAYLRGWQWAGLAREPGENGRPAKTLWDWMQLLIIPAGLALVLLALSNAQAKHEHQREAARAAQATKRAQDATDERVRADAMRGYLRHMTDLLLAKGLRTSKPHAPQRAVASTLTMTLVSQLDGVRKGRVLRFLAGAHLIDLDDPLIDLRGADLSGLVAPSGAPIESLNVQGADLRGADFSKLDAAIDEADFSYANLRGANLTHLSVRTRGIFDGADLRNADLTNAEFVVTSFGTACVTDATFTGAHLAQTSFYSARGLRVDFRGADLREADLRSGDEEAALADLDLRNARGLRDAHLPRGWGKTGVRLTPAQERALCRSGYPT